MSTHLAATPSPPYWAVIFTSQRRSADGDDGDDGYAAMAADLERLAPEQPGFLGLETVRDAASGLGITVSYWTDEESIARWKRDAVHAQAQREGRARWYADYALRVARVERDYTKATSTMRLDRFE
jgi:heme-degrading monooxygenase HmoA